MRPDSGAATADSGATWYKCGHLLEPLRTTCGVDRCGVRPQSKGALCVTESLQHLPFL